MQIKISTRHGHLSAESQRKITEKLEKLTRYLDRMTSIEMTVDLEHEEKPVVELCVSVERTDGFVATDSSSSLMASIDSCIHKLEQQLRKHKEILKGHRTPGHRHQEVRVEGEGE